jgi:hypothetical protein
MFTAPATSADYAFEIKSSAPQGVGISVSIRCKSFLDEDEDLTGDEVFLNEPSDDEDPDDEEPDIPSIFKERLRSFLVTRTNLLLSSEPDRVHVTRRFGGANNAGTMSLAQDPSRKQSAMTLGPSGYSASAPLTSNPTGLRVWSEGYLSSFDDNFARGSQDGDFQVLYTGGDILLGPNVMLGLLGQVDWMDEKSKQLNNNIDGHGWMVGPYLGILLGPVWQLDGRAAWGQSNNDISLLDSKGSFDTDRWLARGSLRGNWYSGPWRLTSVTELGYAEEQQDRFRESGGAIVPGQTVTLGRFTFGPELAYRAEANGFFIEPQVSLQGLWNFDQEGIVVLDGFVSSPDDFYGRLEGGLMFGREGGMTFRAVGTYEGIGASDFEMWSARVWGSLPLN